MKNILLLRLASSLAALSLAALLVPSCADRSPTAITIAIASEAIIPKEIDAISLEVHRGTTLAYSHTYAVDPVLHQAQIPGTLTLSRHDDDSDGAVRVQLRADQKGEQVVLRSASTTFVDEKTKLLRLVLRYSCLDFPQACTAGQTCLGGRCVDEHIDPKRLPDAPDDDQVFPRSSQGGCFEVGDSKCSAGRIALPDLAAFVAAGCTFDASTAPGYKKENLNLFAIWTTQSDQGHPVVVDHDADEGWDYAQGSASTVRLAPGLCDQVKSGVIRKVSFNFACATKSSQLPICQPDKATTAAGTFNDSACHRCAYAPPQCKDAFDKASADAASKPAFDAAFACPYDGQYNTIDECEGVRSCFLGALAPVFGCQGADCASKYAAARAWEACIATLDDPSKRCADCAQEGLPTCAPP